jgi:predicted secreted protein
VLNKVVTAAQFAALRKIAEEMGERLLIITERDAGKTLDAMVGQPIEVQLKGDRPRTGWEANAPEGVAVQREGARPGEVNVSPTLIFTPKPGAADKSAGTYVFRYKAVTPGQAKLRVVYVMPGGPFPIRRRATALVKEFIVTIRVAAPPEKAGLL